MKLSRKAWILALLTAITLSSCGGGAKAKLIKILYENRVSNVEEGDPYPQTGTLLSWGCDGYTRLNEISDGQGGSTTERIDRSADCGWNPPEAGTVLSESCDGYTLVKEIADGEYGSTTERTDRSAQCGWNPPAAGTVASTRCEEPTTQVTVFNDGEYGFYEETDEFSEECGYIPVVVTLVKPEGDRFKPVIIDVDAPQGYEYETTDRTMGFVSQTADGLQISGDGNVGTGYILINDEEYSYDIIPEPRCERTGTYNDCQGYTYSGKTAGYIYYGDDDDQIVEWEIAYWVHDSRFENIGDYYLFEVGDPEWNEAQETIDRYNVIYARSGVHVRYVLAEGNVGKAKFGYPGGYNNLPSIVREIGTADIYIGLGTTCPDTCGCAYVNTYFQENSDSAIGGFSVCGEYTDLHEIGHAVGLAHGPDNYTNAASGYIWFDFGHGHSTPFCSIFADLMSYQGAISHMNSQQTCRDQLKDTNNYIDPELADNPAGSREYADSAYHLNRIRYDVSLIHCGDDKCPESAQAAPSDEEGELGELVIDEIEKFQDGPERMVNEMNRLRRQFNVELGPNKLK